jgi:hypothetical protein
MFLAIEIVGLVVAIVSTFVVWRELRHRTELRMLASMQAVRDASPRRPRRASDDFHDQLWLPLCELIAAQAEKLDYQLSHAERRRIWRSRSPLVLEVLMRELESASDVTTVERLLKELPPGMDRPDPTGWCDH